MRNAAEKETIIALMVGFIVLFAIFSLSWMWMVALAFGCVGILSDRTTRKIHLAWFWIGRKLGFVISKLILAALFFVVLLPLALIARIFRKDFMLLKKDYTSYFVDRPMIYKRNDLENPW